MMEETIDARRPEGREARTRVVSPKKGLEGLGEERTKE
jgi:hypothetical protein